MGLWETAHNRLQCNILQNNFAPPYWQAMGNMEMTCPSALGAHIQGVNHMLVENLPPYVTLHDVDGLSANVGRRQWGDPRFYCHAKLPCSPEYLVDYAHSVSSVLLAGGGASKKCLVLDLDNTLWGGVVGDAGLGGIALGQGDAEGEAFILLQQYIRGLKDRGVILAVCSKNEESVAREPFLKHPEMVLRLDDISIFMANWNDKPGNIRQIATQLNIGLDSLVFLDDNPVERSMVRRTVPEVTVLEVSGDPLESLSTLDHSRLFQMVTFGQDDVKRTEFYRANTQRQEIMSSPRNIGDLLETLDMTATFRTVDPTNLPRTTQLINKTNQFNLTTRRYTTAEVQAISESDNWIACTVTLSDRFGDNGLISVLLGEIEGDALRLDTWLMSCRVFQRTVEHVVFNQIHEISARRGLSRILGEYIPTPKNGLVSGLFSSLGFTLLSDDDGHTFWELTVTDQWQPQEHHIKEIVTHGFDGQS
jgi:FkbH-like protein